MDHMHEQSCRRSGADRTLYEEIFTGVLGELIHVAHRRIDDMIDAGQFNSPEFPSAKSYEQYEEDWANDPRWRSAHEDHWANFDRDFDCTVANHWLGSRQIPPPLGLITFY